MDHSFILSFIQEIFIIIYCASDTVLGTEYTGVNKADQKLLHWSLHSSGRRHNISNKHDK